MAAIEHAGEIMVITDTIGKIVYVNPAFERITGYTRDEALGATPRILKSGEHDTAFYVQLWRTITSGEIWKGRFINRRKDGTRYTEDATISPVRDAAGQIVSFVAVKRDITEEMQMESRLAQAQKMEAIGALASGIAHDFNNLLFPICGMSEMLLDDFAPGSVEHENVGQIYKAALRASDLVKQILSFSRQAEPKKAAVQVQIVLKEVVKLARSTIPSNIEISQNIRNDCGMVLMDFTQLHQVAMNLMTNAYHAVEEKGGTLSVELREVELTEGGRPGTSLKAGPYALITFSDTGCGIDPAIRDKIFEPYFTTKPQGKGTGLGLSVAYGIVKDAGGDIRVTSEVGQGTTFEIYLPLIDKNKAHSATPGADANGAPGGNERILLVDDEAAIARLEKQILVRLGYQVREQASSVDVLNLFRQDPWAFDLVITDMAMPNMTGEVLAREMLAIRADLPIIICTGFSEKIGSEEAMAMGIKGFLMKPVGKGDMARTVRKVLDEVKSVHASA